MKNQQTINCDVKACKFNDCQTRGCNLSCITIVPTEDNKSAHFCNNYEQK